MRFPLYAMLPKNVDKRKYLKTKQSKFYIPNPKFILFSSTFFCQATSAHLQKAKAKPTAYFAKELIFPRLLRFLDKTLLIRNVRTIMKIILQF